MIRLLPSARGVALTATAALVSVACVGTAPGARNTAAPVETVTIRINDKQIAAQAYLYMALDHGYFQQEALDVASVRMDGRTDVVAALAANEIDLADTAPTAPLFNAIAQGVRVKALLSTGVVRPGDLSTGIVVRQDLIDTGRYRSLRDLTGMKIAVQTPGGSTWYVAQQTLANAQLSPEDVQFVVLSFSDALAALATKAVDAAFEVEPLITSAHDRGIASLMIPTADAAPDLQGPMLIVTERYAHEHSDAVQRFVRAAVRGLRDYDRATTSSDLAHGDLVPMIARHTAMQDERLISRIAPSRVDPNGTIQVASLDKLQQYFVKTGQQTQAIDIRGLVDMQFVDLAVAQLAPASP